MTELQPDSASPSDNASSALYEPAQASESSFWGAMASGAHVEAAPEAAPDTPPALPRDAEQRIWEALIAGAHEHYLDHGPAHPERADRFFAGLRAERGEQEPPKKSAEGVVWDSMVEGARKETARAGSPVPERPNRFFEGRLHEVWGVLAAC